MPRGTAREKPPGDAGGTIGRGGRGTRMRNVVARPGGAPAAARPDQATPWDANQARARAQPSSAAALR
jgi:hypothetical protein